MGTERIPGDYLSRINPIEDIALWRLLIWGLTSAVPNRNLDQLYTDMNNRWRKVERAKGAEPSLGMSEAYTHLEMSLPTQLRYTQIL